MKTLILLVLILILAAAAFFTRPSRESFRAMVKQQLMAEPAGVLDTVAADLKADLYMTRLRYVNHYLWASVERESDGRVLYIGAFHHWFSRMKEGQSIASIFEEAPLGSLLDHVVQ